MTMNAKPRMDVVKREDKEDKLKAFISGYLSATGIRENAEPWLLVARSAESPVVLALTALAPAIKGAGIEVKVLLTSVAPSVPDSTAQMAIGFACEMRVARDIRLLDAHEQLRIDAKTSWVGDCMRREPAKRDAYECYANGCAETADWSAKAFGRLWHKSEPVLVVENAPAVVVAPPVPEMDACVPPANQIPSTVVASTRH
jgi:hypothetical protein